MNLNQVTIPSLDLTKSIPFYEELGLKLTKNRQIKNGYGDVNTKKVIIFNHN